MTNRIAINKDNLTWAITRAGLPIDEFLKKNPSVSAWIDGSKQPTIKQLEKFAHKVSVPFGYLFLKNHPQENMPIAFFRTKNHTHHFNLNVYDTITMLQRRQDWVSEQKEEDGCDKLDFIGKFTTKSPIDDVVEYIRELLHYAPDWAFDKKDQAEAVKELTKAFENIGCFVSFLTQVGNQNTRKINVSDCRGFALCDDYAPFIFVNNSDSSMAQMFTLIHEFTHLLLGQSVGDGGEETEDNETEKFCDRVAGHFLVDSDALRIQWRDLNKSFSRVAKKFRVSPLVIAYRAKEMLLIKDAEYRNFYVSYTNHPVIPIDRGSGGNVYRTAIKRIGYSFLIYVRNAVKSNRLLYSDAYALTGFSGNTFETLITQKL